MNRWTPALQALLAELLPGAATEVVGAVAAEVPAYAEPLAAPEGDFAEMVRAGVDQALMHFALPGEDPEWREPIRELGRSVLRSGRALDALLAAYRVGARHAWRQISRAGVDAGIEPEELYRLAEDLFLYIDELSQLSAEGFAAEQAEQAGERQRRRRRLAELLLQVPAADPAQVAGAALQAGWRVPATVAVLAVRDDEPARLAARISGDSLAASTDGIEGASGGSGSGIALVVVPDPGAAGRLANARGAIGPVVAPAEAARSAARARQALALLEDGVLAPAELVRADEHLLELLLHRDPELLAELSQAALAPLQGEPEKLTDTLRAFLRHQGRMDPAARELGVHPQTIRYRVAQLRELLGPALDEPDGRLKLQIALTGG